MKTIKIIIALLMLFPAVANSAKLTDNNGLLVPIKRASGPAVLKDSNGNIIRTGISNWGDFPWAFAYAAKELSATDCGGGTCDDGEDVTVWTDVKGNYDLVPFAPDSSAPSYDINACPNGTPAVKFDAASHEGLFNWESVCNDGNRRCTVIIIGRWVEMPGNYINIFTGVFDDERTKIYTYTGYYRYYAGGTGLGYLNEGPQTKPPNETVNIDLNFHSIIWDLNGTNNNLFTPFTVDDVREPAGVDIYGNGAGVNVPLSGMTLGTSRWGNGQWSSFEYCAVGLYNGNAAADANWDKLQDYVCKTWGLDLGEDSCQ